MIQPVRDNRSVKSALNRFAIQVAPKLTSLIGSDVLDLALYMEVIDELFAIKALTQALQRQRTPRLNHSNKLTLG